MSDLNTAISPEDWERLSQEYPGVDLIEYNGFVLKPLTLDQVLVIARNTEQKTGVLADNLTVSIVSECAVFPDKDLVLERLGTYGGTASVLLATLSRDAGVHTTVEDVTDPQSNIRKVVFSVYADISCPTEFWNTDFDAQVDAEADTFTVHFRPLNSFQFHIFKQHVMAKDFKKAYELCFLNSVSPEDKELVERMVARFPVLVQRVVAEAHNASTWRESGIVGKRRSLRPKP